MGRERGYCQGRITRGGDNRWPPRLGAVTTNGSFSHSFIWSRCVLFPRTKGSTHARYVPPFLHPSIHAWIALRLPARPTA